MGEGGQGREREREKKGRQLMLEGSECPCLGPRHHRRDRVETGQVRFCKSGEKVSRSKYSLM